MSPKAKTKTKTTSVETKTTIVETKTKTKTAITINVTSSSAMAERPRELGEFKKARLNGGTNNHSLNDSHKCLCCRWQTRVIW